MKTRAQTAVEFLLLVGGAVVTVIMVAAFVKNNLTG
jgi:uncharacterized protein (UPF0333 family)